MQSLRTQTLKNAKRRVTYKSKKKAKRPNKGQEKRCVDNFRHLGQSEVETPLGYIDLLTKEYLVEFKEYKSAKGALGQVLCYSHYHPGKKLMVVLFGKGLSTWSKYKQFEKICALYNVEVHKLTGSAHYAPLRKILGEK